MTPTPGHRPVPPWPPASDSPRLLIASLRLDGGTQPRAALDPGAINDYTRAMAAGAKFPRVIVFYDGEHYWLADGFHRAKAALGAGLGVIECDLRQGTREDAQWYSFSANRSNGLRRTNGDIQRAVKAALVHPRAAGLSDSAIARHCGVTAPTVAAWRKRLGLSSKVLKIRTRTVSRNGKTYQQNTSNIGRTSGRSRSDSPSAAHSAPAQPAKAASAVALPQETAKQPKPSRVKRSQRIDHLARLTLAFIESTKHLAHLVGWLGETAGEFDQAESVLGNITTAIANAIAEIERKAIAADPLNASRLGIQENKS